MAAVDFYSFICLCIYLFILNFVGLTIVSKQGFHGKYALALKGSDGNSKLTIEKSTVESFLCISTS